MSVSARAGETMPGMVSLRRGFRPTVVDDGPPTLDDLLTLVARGDGPAFEVLYDEVANAVFGVVRRVLRDPAQSEEVTQEVLVEVWRTATRFDPERGSATTWILTMAHRRAIDRVRSSQASQDRDLRVATRDHVRDYDQVAEQVEARLEQEQVRRCLEQLTDLQRESITLAYYGGHTYREVAELLDLPLGTVKTRLRDGLIRLRDCLGVEP
ncbi:MAG: polymerase sigma-70 factor, subfamily [Actinomycetota bacterium]|jgi:RNA polymerase sigma-70 factor (ECF subfamily)|nr:polymerase sigma-70 factor, subfamily [Actinomycetota bacterium]